MDDTPQAPETPPPARTGWIVGGIAAVAVLVGGIAIASSGATGTSSSQLPGDAGVADGAGSATGSCVYDSYVFIGEETGRLTTPIGGFDIEGAALSPTTDGGLCGYVAVSSLDTGGIVRNEQFAIVDASLDDERTELSLRLDHPSGVAAYGTLTGVPTADGALIFSGMLLDVDNEVPSVEVSGLVLDPEVA
ncbi:MAG: hypothetical protein AAGA42_06205 [Actinomycetota bacterium]